MQLILISHASEAVIPVLEELPAVLADPEVKAYAFYVRVLGLPAGAVQGVWWQSLYGAFGEGKTFHVTASFRGRSIGYSAAGRRGRSRGVGSRDTARKLRSRSGPEGNFWRVS